MAISAKHLPVQQRIAEKARERRDDELAVYSGAKSLAQLKRESESFAFPKDRASINLSSARRLV